MAAVKIKQVNFVDGVYLSGTVVQSIGLLANAEDSGRSLMGLARVARIEPSVPGIMIEMRGRFFLVPWTSVGSCEVEDPFTAEAKPLVSEQAMLLKAQAQAHDLLGDDADLERATRPPPPAEKPDTKAQGRR
jgi:hypothetical protein